MRSLLRRYFLLTILAQRPFSLDSLDHQTDVRELGVSNPESTHGFRTTERVPPNHVVHAFRSLCLLEELGMVLVHHF
jgi:hypothetical protein